MADGMSMAERIKRARIETVEVPEVGTVRIRRLSLGDLDELGKLESGMPWVTALLRRSVVDEEGQPVFGSDAEVNATDHLVLAAIRKAAMELNQFNLVEAKKNSTETDSSASNSGSETGSEKP